jgi:hypothetical protein
MERERWERTALEYVKVKVSGSERHFIAGGNWA